MDQPEPPEKTPNIPDQLTPVRGMITTIQSRMEKCSGTASQPGLGAITLQISSNDIARTLIAEASARHITPLVLGLPARAGKRCFLAR